MIVPLNEIIERKFMDYLLTLKFDKISYRSFFTEFYSKTAKLKVRYWRHQEIYMVENLGIKYFVKGIVIPYDYADSVFKGSEKIEVAIKNADELPIEKGDYVLLIAEFHPSLYDIAGVRALRISETNFLPDTHGNLNGKKILRVENLGRANDLGSLIEQAFLEGPLIIAGLTSGEMPKKYLHWIYE